MNDRFHSRVSTPLVPAFVLLAVLAAAESVAQSAGNITQERVLTEAGLGNNWFLKGGSFAGSHFSPLDDVSVETVDELGLAWSLTIDSPDGIAATPIVVDGVAYLSIPMSIVYAVDAATGEELWRFDPNVRRHFADDPYLSWAARANRGVAVWAGKVYVATAACELIALDAATGRQLWSQVTCDTASGYAITDSPYVGDGKVFVGNAGSESGMKNRGYVSAYDAGDGDLIWRFFVVPSADPAENDTDALKMAAQTWSGDALERYGGGGSAWNEMTYDPATGLLFFGTAGALPYLHSVRSPDGGDNLFTSSVLAVRADTGEYVWHYQTVPEDSWEYNATMNIILAEIRIEGRPRDVLLIAPKNGFFYVLDRTTGQLLSAEKFARVNWATHVNLETGRPELDPAGMFWTGAVGETRMIWPNMWGAHSWQPMAYHPQTGLTYIPVIDVPQVVVNGTDGDFTDHVSIPDKIDGKDHSPGKLIAWDPVSQSSRWVVDHAMPGNGGILATAGNLVFQGGGSGEFSAYRADNGTKVWGVSTGSAINAAPVSYRANGRQYILVPAGAGGGMQFLYPEQHANRGGPSRLLAFSLGSDKQPDVAADRRPELLPIPDTQFDTSSIAAGQELYADHCRFCHGKDVVARQGGSVPDLRYSGIEVHQAWSAIVVSGALRGTGMPAFDIPENQSEAIRAFVHTRAKELRNQIDR